MIKVIGAILLLALAILNVSATESSSSTKHVPSPTTKPSPTTNASPSIEGPTFGFYHPCTCAAMDTAEYDAKKTAPLTEISMNILPLCGEKGSALCAHFCRDLTEKTEKDPNGGNEFCKNVKKDISNVHVHVYSKACDGDYKYTGSKCDEAVCCVKGKISPCSK